MKTKHLSIAIILAYCCVVAVFAYYEIWLGDDAEYLYKAAESGFVGMSDEPVRTFGDVLESQWNHYFNINGRTPAHLLVQSFCALLGQTAFVVCNFIVYLIFFYLLLRCGRIPLSDVRGVLLAVVVFSISFRTSTGPSCQIGYFWVFCLAMWWMLKVQKYRDREKASTWGYVGLFVLALFAGWGQEALNVGICFAILVYMATHLRQMRAPQWVLFIGFGLGTLLIVASPAAWERAATLETPAATTAKNFLKGIRCFYLLCIYSAYLLATKRATLKALYRQNAFFLHGIAFLYLFNLIISVFTYRQLFGAELLALLALLNTYKTFGIGRVPYAAVAIGLLALSVYVNVRAMRLQLQSYYFNKYVFKELSAKPDGTRWKVTLKSVTIPKTDDYEEDVARVIYFKTGKLVRFRLIQNEANASK